MSDIQKRQLGLISIRELLESVRNVLQPLAEEKELEIRLISTASDQRHGFGLALGRVRQNLTTNGLEFTERGIRGGRGQTKRSQTR